MAKRKAKTSATRTRSARKAASKGRSAKRPSRVASARGRAKSRKPPGAKRAPAGKARKKHTKANVERRQGRARSARKPAASRVVAPSRKARLDRVRRTLDDIVQSPPSSLDMDRRGSAARTGRAEIAETLRDHRGMTDVTAGDVDVDVEDAFFAGEEAPGGDNPTPDQDIVDDIGKALGVQYADNEELKGADKLIERDRKRWELDPASSEDYKERK
jgi:uncharacterized protein DUF6335